jgi:predicted NAD-dependent protein-ADP-ribosyltransferase YbiA (DUF1768 family)
MLVAIVDPTVRYKWFRVMLATGGHFRNFFWQPNWQSSLVRILKQFFFFFNKFSPIKKVMLTTYNLYFLKTINDTFYFLGLAYQGKNIVFRFIIEYISSLRDFDP